MRTFHVFPPPLGCVPLLGRPIGRQILRSESRRMYSREPLHQSQNSMNNSTTPAAIRPQPEYVMQMAGKLWETVSQAQEDARNLSTTPKETRFVACAVFTVSPSCRCLVAGAPSCPCPVVESPAALGINYALHRHINRPIGVDAEPAPLLPGILKGCAEQNALGAIAAQGIPYHRVRSLVVVGSNVVKRGDQGQCTTPSCTPMLPCYNCQQYFHRVQKIIHHFFPQQPKLSITAVSEFDSPTSEAVVVGDSEVGGLASRCSSKCCAGISATPELDISIVHARDLR